MKFYAIKQSGVEVGRMYLGEDGIGRLDLDGQERPFVVVLKSEREVRTEPVKAGCQKWEGHGEYGQDRITCGCGAGGSGREPHGN